MAYVTLSENFWDDDHGNRWRLRVLNLQDLSSSPETYPFTVSTPQALDISRGGVNWSYDGDLSDGAYSPIITSKLEIDFFVSNDEEHEYIKYLSETPDWKIGCHLTMTKGDLNTPANWYGILLPDQFKVELGGYPYQVKVVFVDGLTLLKEVPYKELDDRTPYQDTQTLKITIGRAVTRIRDAWNYFKGSTPNTGEVIPWRIVEFIDLWSPDIGNSVNYNIISILHNLKIKQDTFNRPSVLDNPVGKGFKVFEDTMTCYEVLEHICIALGCRMHMFGQNFYFISPTTYLNNGSCRGFRHDNTSLIGTDDGDDRLEDPTLAESGINLLTANTRGDYDDLQDYDMLEGSTRSRLLPLRGMVYTHKNSGSNRALGGRYPIPRTAADGYQDSWSWTTSNLQQFGNESAIENVFTHYVMYSRLRSAIDPDSYFDFEDLSVANNPFNQVTQRAKHDYYEAPALVEERTRQLITLQGITESDARDLMTWNEDNPLEDTDFAVPANTPFRLQTTAYVHTNFDEDRTIGCKIVMRLKIKVGDYYLKQHVTHASFADDEIPHTDGFEIIKPGANARYKPLRAADPAEWTQTSTDRFEIVLNNPDLLETPVDFPALVHIDDDGNSHEYGGGVATILEPRTDDSDVDRLRYRNSFNAGDAEKHHNFRMAIDISIPELPNDDTGTGLEIYLLDAIAYDAGGTLFTETEMDEFVRANLRFENVKFYVGTGEKSDNSQYFTMVEPSAALSDVVDYMPPTIVGIRGDGWFGKTGYLHTGTNYDLKFHTFLTTSTYPDEGNAQTLLLRISEEHMRLRSVGRDVYELRLLPPAYESGATFKQHPRMEDRIVITIDGEDRHMMPISMSTDCTTGEVSGTFLDMGRDNPTLLSLYDGGRNPLPIDAQSPVGPLPVDGTDFTRRASDTGRRPGLPVDASKKLGFITMDADRTGIQTFIGSTGGGATVNIDAADLGTIMDGAAARDASSRSEPYDRIATIEGDGGLGELAVGKSGQFLKSLGTGGSPVFADLPITQVYSLGFLDDIGTTKHYLPFKDINEQTTPYQEEAAFVMPYDGRLVSVSIRPSQINATGNLTVDISTLPVNSGIFSTSNWTIEESETLAYATGDTNHVFHFVFSNAQHFDAGEAISLGIQASVDPGSFTYWYVTAVLEFDTTGNLGEVSQEHED